MKRENGTAPYDPDVPKKVTAGYRILRAVIRAVFPRLETAGAENVPEEGAIIVGNHAQMYGPVACELDLPFPRYTWCEWEMMDWKEVPGYSYRDFWSRKPKAVRWFYKLASYAIVPIAVSLFNNANTIPVFHDKRLARTIRETIEKLEKGTSVVIFPEHGWEPYNRILYPFQERFIDVARLYHKKHGRELSFVPLYIAPDLKRMVLGRPVRFRADQPLGEERERICRYLTEEITRLAEELPLHTVVPYRNIPKRDYPKNRAENSASGETDGRAAII